MSEKGPFSPTVEHPLALTPRVAAALTSCAPTVMCAEADCPAALETVITSSTPSSSPAVY